MSFGFGDMVETGLRRLFITLAFYSVVMTLPFFIVMFRWCSIGATALWCLTLSCATFGLLSGLLGNLLHHRIQGLKSGGDDYLTKPFALGELLARLDALRRRSEGSGRETALSVDDLRLDLLSRRATRGQRAITLLPREFKLLEYLMQHADEVVTRTMLLENVWDYHFDPQTNIIDVHISKLRQKIDTEAERPLLRTIRSAGYMMASNG